ncbi:MAG: hypothetical protein E7213_01230 [Clostridium sp.]|nr:hypothetical protein [Clostridium sp.]
MEENPFKSFQDFIDYCNKSYNESSESKNQTYSSGGDIPGGFQTINPQFFLALGEIMGNVMAGQMPFNVQNVIGNWLQLIGQAIETYNAQQQYMQAGPGRYYDIRNLNINNPFSSNNGATAGQSMNNDVSQNSNNKTSNSETSDEKEELFKMKRQIRQLEQQVDILQKELQKMKNNK